MKINRDPINLKYTNLMVACILTVQYQQHLPAQQPTKMPFHRLLALGFPDVAVLHFPLPSCHEYYVAVDRQGTTKKKM